MPRYYYDCPVKTFYMMKYFDVEIIHPERSYGLASKAINFIEYFLFKHGKIYVAKESEKIFKFKKTDLVKYGFGSVGFYDQISQRHAITEIIYRNGKQFFMPEVEIC
jgi:hypothetical protein